MRIGIDARFYGPLGKGLGRYTQKLVTYLEKIDRENDYFILLRKNNWADYQPINKRFTKVLADYQWYSFTEQLFMPLKIWSLRLDLMHFTHFNVPLLYFGKFLVTIHDLILLKYPTQRASTLAPYWYKIKNRAYKLTINSAVKRAEKIIAVSEYTKKEVIDYFKINSEKVVVTYEAVEEPQQLTKNSEEILYKYRIKKPYILYVGNVYPHKNIEGLLVSFKKIVQEKNNLFLVLVGKDDYFFTRLKKEVKMGELDKSVIFPGFVTDEDLPYIYKNAEVYVFPSFYEGFGLPALEACSYDVPVVASNNSSLPEVLGSAAIYFNPKNVMEMTDKILQVLNDHDLSKKLINQCQLRINSFSWKKMAEISVKLYNSVISRN